jgi:predicted NBD/HSP70 family sugar kinase
MRSIGIDVHKVNSQVCIVGENGEVIEERRIHTERSDSRRCWESGRRRGC